MALVAPRREASVSAAAAWSMGTMCPAPLTVAKSKDEPDGDVY